MILFSLYKQVILSVNGNTDNRETVYKDTTHGNTPGTV
jgi:hypothetical protein